MHDHLGTPTDLNLMMRGVLVAIVFVVLGALVVGNPAPWSALGQAGQQERSQVERPTAPESSFGESSRT